MEQINVDVNNGNMSRVDISSSYYIIDIRMNRIKRVIEGIVAFDPVVCASYPNLTLESFDFNTAYYSDKGVYRFTAQVIDPMTNEYLQDLLGIMAREFRCWRDN